MLSYELAPFIPVLKTKMLKFKEEPSCVSQLGSGKAGRERTSVGAPLTEAELTPLCCSRSSPEVEAQGLCLG